MGLILTDIVAEFGQYTVTKEKKIFGEILQPSNIEKYCTTKSGVKGNYQMARAEVSELTQPFQKAWTPKGEVEFKPSEITMRRAKIDYSFHPDDIFHSWLSFLDAEGKSREEWPISRYIISIIVPKAKEERGKTALDGVYAPPTPGTAGTRVQTFDGFLKILTDISTAGSGNEIATGALTTTPYDKVRSFMRSIPPEVFDACGRRVFASKSIVDAVFDDYEDNNPNKELKEVGGDDYGYFIKGTQGGKIIGLDGMGSSERIFASPKWNILKLVDQIDEFGNLELQKDKRELNLLADYATAYGFGFPAFVYHNDIA